MTDMAQRLLDRLDKVKAASGKLVRMIAEAFGLDPVGETPHNDVYMGQNTPPIVLAKGPTLHQGTLRQLSELLASVDSATSEDRLAELLRALEGEQHGEGSSE